MPEPKDVARWTPVQRTFLSYGEEDISTLREHLSSTFLDTDEWGLHTRGRLWVDSLALRQVAALEARGLVSWREKWPGLLTGVLVLSILNILRIAGLYLAGLYWPSLFEILHLHGGVVIFLMFSIVLWLIWVNRILNRRQTNQK